jgi:hypothetical protein
VASAGCRTAVDRANLMLASAVGLQAAMAEQGRILRDPATHRLTGSKLLQTVAPWLRASSGESARFNRALAAYRQVVNRCELLAP